MTDNTPQRVSGKRGRLQVLPEQRLALGFLHEYAPSPLPVPKYPIDVSAGITNWKMLGNGPDPTCTVQPDGVGNCTFVGRQHYRMAKAARGHEHIRWWESSNVLVNEYLAYNGGQDLGANIPSLLLDWYHAGKIMAFAPVDHNNASAVDAAMQAFAGVYAGVSLTDDADQLFSEGEPWTVADGQRPNRDDGHCIIKVGADGKHFDTWVTWGALQKSTRGWTRQCLDEAWVVITNEDTWAPKYIDLAALKTDIDKLGGTG